MSKKNKKPEAPEEEVIATEEAVEAPAAEEPAAEEPAVEEPAVEAAAENIAVSGDPSVIEPAEEIKADEVNGAEAPASEEAVDVTETRTGVVSRPVNFRTGASFRNAVIAELKAGSKLAVTGTVAGDKGKWYECEFDGRKGFVKASGVMIQD